MWLPGNRGSGGRIGCLLTRRMAVQFTASPGLHAHVASTRTLDPKLPPTPPAVYECDSKSTVNSNAVWIGVTCALSGQWDKSQFNVATSLPKYWLFPHEFICATFFLKMTSYHLTSSYYLSWGLHLFWTETSESLMDDLFVSFHCTSVSWRTSLQAFLILASSLLLRGGNSLHGAFSIS